ncbi:MAG: VapC toxin family PIN domain ribonuclease [Verrucomicrobia bacterium]|nr:VapC toxin family PIN domain ribonuclease [Verrucomicrobiota bacterium]
MRASSSFAVRKASDTGLAGCQRAGGVTGSQHLAHGRAHAWLAQNLGTGWASCPLTENGCLRVLTNPRYAAPVPALDVLAKLATAKTGGHHEFWADDLTITDTQVFDRTKWRGHQQVTDTYLLALAVKHSGRLVTFDTGIALDTVRGAMPHHLLVL